MATFLTLSRELRDIILDFVLQTPSHKQINTSLSPQAREALDGLLWWTHAHRIKSETVTGYRRPESLSLPQTNKQIHCETKERLHRFGKYLTYKLDLAIVNKQELRPTWTQVPAQVKCIPEVSVTLRNHGTRRGRASVSGFAHDGERAPLAWALLSLLDRSLLFGPIARVHVYRNKKGTPFARENGKNKCAIQKLHIDIGKSTLEELHLPGFRSAK
jgi:hypothetical protein